MGPRALRGRSRLSNRRRGGRRGALALCAVAGLAAGVVLPRTELALGGAEPAVRSVAVSGTRRVTPEELVRLAGVAPGTPLRALDLRGVEERVASHAWVASVRAAALPPDHVLLAVRERESVARAWLGDPPRPWHVDREGRPFAPVPAEPPGPRIRAVGSFAPGEPHAALAQALRILDEVRARGLPPVREVWVGEGDDRALPALVLEGGAGPQRVVLGAGALAPKLDRLAALLAAARAETAGAAAIDVRFGGQVILRGDPSAGSDGTAEPRGGAGPPATGRAG